MTGAVDDLTCRELVELVTDYLEERLPPDERSRLDSHLAECDGCRAYLRQMEQVLRSAGRLGEESLAPDSRDALLEAFRAWRGGPGGRRP
jgi:anti-sigma factor RsiW